MGVAHVPAAADLHAGEYLLFSPRYVDHDGRVVRHDGQRVLAAAQVGVHAAADEHPALPALASDRPQRVQGSSLLLWGRLAHPHGSVLARR